jgi:hypothetical protein
VSYRAIDNIRCNGFKDAIIYFFRGVTVRAVWPIPLIVGTFLSALHQGSTVMAGAATWATWAKIGISYAVPFVVASAGYLRACSIQPTRPTD